MERPPPSYEEATRTDEQQPEPKPVATIPVMELFIFFFLSVFNHVRDFIGAAIV